MNIRTISKYLLLAACLAVPFLPVQADEYRADDPAVMAKVIRSRMLPIAMSAPHDMGTLFFSDSPEYAADDGILYVDKASGPARVYFYHVNQNRYPRKIVVMAYNPSQTEADISVSGVYYSKPSTSYYDVGKDLSTLYYEGNSTYSKVTVPPMGYAVLSDRLNHIIVKPDQLFSGIINMTLPVEMNISTVIMPAAEDPVRFIKKQKYLASDDVKLRGTFPGMDRSLKTLIPFSTDEGIGYIVLADGVQDRFLRGYDAIDNRLSEDVGNYGLDYTVAIKTKGNGMLHYYFNTQGGEYAGVAEISYDDGQGGTISKIVELPRKGLSMGYDNAYAMEYLDSVNAGTTVTIHLMPPGAANLPVRLLVVPDKDLQKAADAVREDEQLRLENERQAREREDAELAAIEKKLHGGKAEAQKEDKKNKKKSKNVTKHQNLSDGQTTEAPNIRDRIHQILQQSETEHV